MLKQQHIMPYIRTFKIENIPRVKISLTNDESKLEINRLFIPIESKEDTKYIFKQKSNIETQSKIEQIMNMIDHEQAYNHHEQYSTSFIPINFINEQQLSLSKISSINSNKTVTPSSVIRVEQPLSPPLSSQLIPDSIINDKQATNRIFNEQNSTYSSKFIRITPINSLQKKISESIDDNSSSSNNVRYYQIGSIFTSTSTFIMHQNEVIAHSATSNPFLSDTIFIILIATLTVIILLFCLGLFCLCRRSTKRNISPSFDGSSYDAGLNGHSFAIPIDDPHQQQQQQQYQRTSKPYITDILSSYNPPRSSINQTTMTNDRSPAVLHQTLKQKLPINNKKIKKKRVGCCCCNSKQASLKTINARTL